MIRDMSTSPATAEANADAVDVMISAAVRGLIAQRRIVPAHVAAAVGVSRSAIFAKLSAERPWKAAEVDRLAQFFRVSRDSLYEGRAEFSSSTAANLDARTRSSTDRASDYGSRVGRFAPAVRRGRRRTDGRHLSVVCEAIPA